MRTLVASVVAVLALSSCSEPTAEGPAIPATPDLAVPSQSADEFFLDNIERELPQYPIQDEAGLIEAGKGVCTYFEDNGVSLLNLGMLTNEFLAQGFTNNETATIFVISTTAYCPDIKDEILSMSGTGI